jgi:ribosomal protein S18 acetylase RimI-like enzyme
MLVTVITNGGIDMNISNTVNRAALLKNGLTLTVRNVTPDDAESVVAYMDAVGGESNNLTFGAGELEITAEKEREIIDGVHRDGRSVMLAGYIGWELTSVSSLKCLERPRVRHNSDFSITVREKFWNLGVGDAMLRAVVDYARERGDIKNITLGVRAGNDGAVHLYEKHGFVRTGMTKDYFRFGDGSYCDAYLMDLYL